MLEGWIDVHEASILGMFCCALFSGIVSEPGTTRHEEIRVSGKDSVVGTAPTMRTVVALGWPLAMNALLLQATLIIDTILVTPLGEASLAAMGLAASLAGLLVGILFAFSNGTQLIVAQAVGAQQFKAISSGFWSGLLINLSLAVVGVCLILTGGPALLNKLAEVPSIGVEAFEYLQVFCGVILGLAIVQNITVFFNARGKSRIPFYSNLLELPVNAGLSLVLIHGLLGFPAMGLAGAAIGSLVAVCIRALFLAFHLWRVPQAETAIPTRSCRDMLGNIKRHLSLAWPIAGSFISMTFAMSICMMLYSRLGINQFAALTLVFPWIRIGGLIVTSWAQAMGIFVGQMLGRNDTQALDSFVSQAWRFAFYLSLLVASLYLLMIFSFQWLYPDLQPETRRYLLQFLPVLLVLPLIRSSNTICGNLMRAGGDAAYSMNIHLSAQWLVTVPLTAVLVLYFSVPVFWIFSVVLLEETIKAWPFHRRIFSGRWKRQLA
ncbi:Multidrug resistance protein MdtK [Granulosicoccus antarcticus IMCC3135]|uniref:Multidrug resistance protein MdtK n=2 Tax=Granulosicoccus TaxID=437504 RepID=A0A2Z2NKG7_9GAMM|nr:Multidrug resistance protein MdtK [Granulosicoccus antarcticus IMCC3135]